MSRMDSGKSPRISTPGRPGPRKLPLYSPSERSPFSFNDDTLKILATDIEQQNGLIPLNIPIGGGSGTIRCFSQPQTPSEERRSILPGPDTFSGRRVPSSPLNVNSSFSFQPGPGAGLGHSHSFTGQPGAGVHLSHSVGASSAGTPGKTMRDYDESFKEMKKENFNLKLRIFFLEERLGQGKKTSADELANANLELKIQLESCKQDLAEKNVLLAEASGALEDLENQVESQKLIIKSYENSSGFSSHPSSKEPSIGPVGPMFELGTVPKTKKGPSKALSPDVSRKPLMSPKFSHKTFFGQDDVKIINSSKENVLSILKEEETSDAESKSKEYLYKIHHLEESLKLSRETQKQLSEKLRNCENNLSVMSNQMKNSHSQHPWREIEMDVSRLTSKNIHQLKPRSECSTQTQLEENNSQPQMISESGSGKLVEECHGLKSENRKIRDQLKLQVQERKLLLKKISMLKEQLGSLSETEHKTLPLSSEQYRPPTSCADIGTQCDKDIIPDRRYLDDKIENPLSDTSTWNTELPNIADVQLCSSPELLFDCEQPEQASLLSDGVGVTLIEHLSQQLETCKSQIEAKTSYIAALEEDMAVKEEQLGEYREEFSKLEDSMHGLRLCPEMRRTKGSDKRRRLKPRIGAIKFLTNRDSVDTDEWSEPETGVSIQRIGLPNSFPELFGCDTDKTQLDTEDEEKNKKFYSLDFSRVGQDDIGVSDTEPLPPPVTDYSSIMEELRSHRQELRKLHRECSSGLAEVQCNSNLCLASGGRVLEGLLATLLTEVSALHALDSGIESSEDIDIIDIDKHKHGEFNDVDKFSLCSSCTSSIPKEFDELLKNTHLGLNSALHEVESLKSKIVKILNKNKQLVKKDKADITKAEENKTRLNENYILIAKLSSENLRLLGEYSKLETSLEDLKRSSTDLELRLQDEITTANTRMFDKERQVERLQLKIGEFERSSFDMSRRLEDLQQRGSSKMSPDTSSSFDFFPAATSSINQDTFRPRAFSAVSSSNSQRYKERRDREAKMLEISSPDLGVDLLMESDMYSSLERGNTQKVGSLAFEKIVQDNRALRHEREILTQKLGKSKSALKETLIRLSKSNLQKQDQVGSPSLPRRGLSQSRSQGGLAGGASRAGTIERDLSLNSILGTKKLAKKL